jgi:hypothetical protein
MGVPTSEVGYTPAMPRREDHEVHKGHVVAMDQKKNWKAIRNGCKTGCMERRMKSTPYRWMKSVCRYLRLKCYQAMLTVSHEQNAPYSSVK